MTSIAAILALAAAAVSAADGGSALAEPGESVFMSPEPTKWRFHTFMEDPVYRISVLTQNNGYNLPTGTGFYFGPDLLGHDILFRGTRLP